jgi:ribosomal protein S18
MIFLFEDKKMKKKTNKNKRIIRKDPKVIDFEIDYKNYEKLAEFLSDRAKIYGRARTAITAKQQRRLTIAIKRARHLGLLPFSSRI